MNRCDFCEMKEPDGKCWWESQVAREDDCIKAIKRMMLVMKTEKMKKFEFTGETKLVVLGFRRVKLHRIRAVVDFDTIKRGDIGGWIEKEENLSHNGKAWVYGDAKVYSNAEVCGDTEVFCTSHVLVVGAIGSRSGFTTFYRSKNKNIMVRCGCFNNDIQKFLKKVKQTHNDSKYALVYRAAAEIAKLQIDLSVKIDENGDNE